MYVFLMNGYVLVVSVLWGLLGLFAIVSMYRSGHLLFAKAAYAEGQESPFFGLFLSFWFAYVGGVILVVFAARHIVFIMGLDGIVLSLMGEGFWTDIHRDTIAIGGLAAFSMPLLARLRGAHLGAAYGIWRPLYIGYIPALIGSIWIIYQIIMVCYLNHSFEVLSQFFTVTDKSFHKDTAEVFYVSGTPDGFLEFLADLGAPVVMPLFKSVIVGGLALLCYGFLFGFVSVTFFIWEALKINGVSGAFSYPQKVVVLLVPLGIQYFVWTLIAWNT